MIVDAKKQKDKTLWFYLIVASLFLIVSVGLFLWYTTMPYQSSQILIVKIIHYALTGLFAIFSFIFFAIKFKRIKNYYKSVKLMKEGIREKSEGSFFEYSDEVEEKDGVDFKALIFIEWNKYKKDYFERKVLVYNELAFPQIPQDAYVEYVTVGNVLVEYEILEEQSDEEKDDQIQVDEVDEDGVQEQEEKRINEPQTADIKNNTAEDNL